MRAVVLYILIALTGCVARPTVVKTDNAKHLAQNRIIEQKVIELAGTGDWLVTRGYHATDDLVSNTTGIPISHVGVFHAGMRQVVEAEGKGVHLSTLAEFVDKSYRLLIIRPRWRTDANAESAWANALKLVGKSYDFLGTIGFDYPDSFYCSELAVHIYREWFTKKERFPRIIKPGEMYLFGTVEYDSLPRDEFQAIQQ